MKRAPSSSSSASSSSDEESGGAASKRHKSSSSAKPVRFDKRRSRWLTECKTPIGASRGARCVVYWMSRDQRADDNWALLRAQALAAELQVPLRVCFVLAPKFLAATLRMYDFMLGGLAAMSVFVVRSALTPAW